MKRILILSIILFICIIGYISSYNGILKLSNCLRNTGAEIKEIDIEGNGRFYCNEDLKDIALNIYKASGIKDKYYIYQKDGETIITSNNVVIKIKKVPKENLNYASFILSQHVNNKNINNIRNSINKGFSIYNLKPTFSYLIEGEYNQKMDISEMKEKANEILHYMGAVDIKGIDDRNLVSFSGFTPMIDERIKVINYYTNLNVALRYNKDNCNTHIWIGCPIIASEY